MPNDVFAELRVRRQSPNDRLGRPQRLESPRRVARLEPIGRDAEMGVGLRQRIVPVGIKRPFVVGGGRLVFRRAGLLQKADEREMCPAIVRPDGCGALIGLASGDGVAHPPANVPEFQVGGEFIRIDNEGALVRALGPFQLTELRMGPRLQDPSCDEIRLPAHSDLGLGERFPKVVHSKRRVRAIERQGDLLVHRMVRHDCSAFGGDCRCFNDIILGGGVAA